MKTMKPKLSIASQLIKQVTYPTFFSNYHQEEESTWRPRESGTTKIDINICLYDDNTQSTTSVSYSSEQDRELGKEVQRLTETYVKDVEEAFSKGSPGNTETKD